MSLAEARLSASFISNSLHFGHYAEITRRRAGLTSTFDTTDLEMCHVTASVFATGQSMAVRKFFPAVTDIEINYEGGN
jgi:hypothetical protein